MKRMLAVLLFVTAMSPLCHAVDTSGLSQLVGYTVVASTNATGTLEGADFDKLVQLDNGMIFKFETYDYFYAYNPEVIIFAKSISVGGRNYTDYKLVIEDQDDVYDVTRIR